MVTEITEENFGLYFRDAAKNKKEDGDLTVSYRSVMELPDCELKRDVIRLLSESDNGAIFAVEALCRYAAAAKQDAIRLCTQISVELLKGNTVEKIASKQHLYESVLFFYVKPEHFPIEWLQQKNTAWAVVPDEIKEADAK